MKEQILVIITGLFLISFVSAITITSGDNYTFSINTTNELFYDVVGNSSDLDGLIITQDVFEDYSNITLLFDLLYKPDSFTLIFFEEEVKEIQIPSGGGGGGTRVIERKVEVPKYIDREIKVEKEVIKEVPSSPEIKKEIPKWVWIVFWLLVVIIVIMAIFLYYRNEIKSDGNGTEPETSQ